MLRQILERAERTRETPGVTPGGVLLYGDQGRDVATVSFGHSHIAPHQDDLPAVGPDPRSEWPEVFEVTADTVYDVASLTKVAATVAVLMKLEVELDRPVAPLVPELVARGTDAITFAQLVGHASGFPAHIKFYERLLAGERLGASSPREALLRMIGATELAYPPGTRTVYSDLGFIVLGFAIERLTGKRLDACARELVHEPLGMSRTFFVDLTPGAAGTTAGAGERIAPTEVCPYRGLVHRAVHDDNAHAAGGVVGHAGLFSTAGDLARFARAILCAATGEPSDGPGGFSPTVVQRLFTTSAAPDTTWRLGWDRPSLEPGRTNAGDLWPKDGVGHLGFTGCSLWLDVPRGRYVVLLTNRVHPSRDEDPTRPGIRALRREVMDAVVRALGG